ncbi:MAG: amidohydrolase family protein [Bacteroidota bacterium]
MRLDSHQHFWQYEPVKHAWIDDEMASIRKDFLPNDLGPLLQANHLDGCIAVQADQTTVETDFLLSLAQQYDFIKGVVGWIDLRAKDLVEQLAKYEGASRLVGWRHVVQGEPDPLFLLRDNFLRGIDTIGQAGYTYDILIFPHQLVSAYELVKQFPEHKFVIDHLAKPYAKAGYFTGWARAISAVAELPNVYCKLSGLVTEADYQDWTPAQLAPYLRHALEAFGPDRCMYGSDWPVCRVAATYGRVIGLVEQLLAPYTAAEQAAVMGENCRQFYGL